MSKEFFKKNICSSDKGMMCDSKGYPSALRTTAERGKNSRLFHSPKLLGIKPLESHLTLKHRNSRPASVRVTEKSPSPLKQNGH